VYPGANHTRFHHVLGCMHLMQKSSDDVRFKGVLLSTEEENALYIAILLHDIGHGPFTCHGKALLKMCIMKKFHCL
jgi:HD superfamily phosphohydrolase